MGIRLPVANILFAPLPACIIREKERNWQEVYPFSGTGKSLGLGRRLGQKNRESSKKLK